MLWPRLKAIARRLFHRKAVENDLDDEIRA